MITYEEFFANPVECELWGYPEEERLVYRTIDEAIEAILDDGFALALPSDDEASIVVAGFQRQSARGFLDRSIVEVALERLDEEFGDPDSCHYSEPTEAMLAAEAAFIEAVLADYTVWACEQAVTVRVPILPWVREHRPDWMEDDHG